MLAGLAVAALGVLSGSSWLVDTPVGAARPQPALPPLPTLAPVPAVQIDRLTTAVRPQPSTTRDPFRFVGASPESGHARAANTDMPVGTVDLAPPRPEMQLIGLAEDDVDGKTVRTAVITSLNQVYLVREGEQIALRYLVDRIGADAVQLRDLADDSPIVLPLR